MTRQGKRLLVIEEALQSRVGHFFEYLKSVGELNRAEGVEVVTGVHAKAGPDILQALDAHALFARSNWDGVYNYPQAWKRYLAIVRHNWLVWRTLARFIDRHGPFDVLFAPTVVIYQVIGLRLLMATHGRRIGRMVILFRNNAGAYPDGSSTPVFKKSAKVLALALKSFAPLIARGRAVLCTDSTRLATEYEHLSGLRPDVFPSPRVAPFLENPRPAPDHTQPIVMSCLGPARFEKGIDILQDAIKLYLQKPATRPVKFVIQWNAPILDETGQLYEPDPALVSHPAVELLTRSMSSEEYEQAVAGADVMLLPYRRASYFARISGVAVEAVTAGMPVIYTNDTWCEDLVTSVGEGLGARDGDVADLARVITETVENFDAMQARAAGRVALARNAHSAAAFQDCLWGR